MSDLVRILGGLWHERGRIGLVSLGVLWGTLSLGMLLAFGRSMTSATNATANNFGVNLLRVGNGSTTKIFEGLPAGRGIQLRYEDAELLKAVPGVSASCAEYSTGNQVIAIDGEPRNVPAVGVGPPFGELRQYIARPGGRFITAKDVDEHRRVCFLGHGIALDLFGQLEVVGRTVEMGGVPLVVIGVADSKICISNYNGTDDEKIAVPATTFADINGWRFPSHLWAQLDSPEVKETAIAGIYRALGARHRFDQADEEALDLLDYLAIRAMIDEILAGNSIFTGIVGLLGFLVSAVGVANVMLALVDERRHELGIELALGARPSLLASERLVEGILITSAGGVAGLAACALLFWGLNLMPLPPDVTAYLGRPQLDATVGLTVLVLLVGAGALSGWIPARLASRLDPVTILREE